MENLLDSSDQPLKTRYSHFFLYAKGHYQRTLASQSEDLRRIVGHCCALDVQSVTELDIARLLSLAVLNYISNIEPQRSWLILDQLFMAMAKDPVCQPPRSARAAIIQECLSFLSTSKILDKNGRVLVELEAPDPEILPLSRDNRPAAQETAAAAMSEPKDQANEGNDVC